MRCKTVPLDGCSLKRRNTNLTAQVTEVVVNAALAAIEDEGNRIVAVHLLGRLGPGEVTTIENGMLMVFFEPPASEVEA